MAPARMERHVAVGIIDADQFGNDLCGNAEALDIDGEMRKLAAQPGRQHLVRALADGMCRQERTRGSRIVSYSHFRSH